MSGSPAPRAAVRARRRRGEAGLTLIEVLVVLTVIGISAGATMLGVNAADRDAGAQSEAVRLARNLSLSVDEALIAGQPLALVWDAQGYRFVMWSGQEWRAAGPGVLATRHDLRAPLVLGQGVPGQADANPTNAAPTGSQQGVGAMAGDASGVPVLIAPDGTGPAAAFQISRPVGEGPRWLVEFDGFSTSVRRGDPA